MLSPASAAAQTDPRFAADRYEPSERGSEWFANESLNLHGPMPFRAGVTSSYGERLFVVRDANGKALVSPLRNDEVLHVGASATPVSFLRLGVNMPLHLITAGRATRLFPAPAHEQGIGDLRFGADVRVYGKDHGVLRLAMGAQLWAPVGQQEQWASDDTWRIRPRVVVAGEKGIWQWSAQVGVNFRDERIGTDVGLNGAAGVRLFDQLVIGPELVTSTNVTQGKGAFQRGSTPFELMLGAHWLIAHTIRVGAGLGRGFTYAATDPNYRVLGMLEYAPEFGPRPPEPPRPPPVPPPPPPPGDADHDGIPDDKDACPAVAGIAATDASQNGCPPDTDGDHINDLGDACPTQPGPATDDPATTGCPTTPAPAPAPAP